MESCAKELTARLLAKVIRKTPVGEYDKNVGKSGGTLRRGWKSGQFMLRISEEELRHITQGVLNKKLKIFMESVFDDK